MCCNKFVEYQGTPMVPVSARGLAGLLRILILISSALNCQSLGMPTVVL